PPFKGQVVFSDLDGDGKLDVIGVGGSTVRVYRNISTIGSFSFESVISFPVGQSASSIAFGDIDGDGKTDLITANTWSNTISILRNISINQVINFAPQQDYA